MINISDEEILAMLRTMNAETDGDDLAVDPHRLSDLLQAELSESEIIGEIREEYARKQWQSVLRQFSAEKEEEI